MDYAERGQGHLAYFWLGQRMSVSRPALVIKPAEESFCSSTQMTSGETSMRTKPEESSSFGSPKQKNTGRWLFSKTCTETSGIWCNPQSPRPPSDA